jgi:DNA polymerase III sliding clamp (beta) subunit (PCNA family)
METQTTPTTPEITTGWIHAQTWQDLATLAHAASSDDSRPIITSVLIWQGDNGLEGVATDSYRLAHMTIKLTKSDTNFEPPVFAMAAKDLTASAKWIKDAKTKAVSAELTSDTITFTTTDGRTTTYPTADSEHYPNWRQLMQPLKTAPWGQIMDTHKAMSFDLHMLASAAKIAPWHDKREKATATLYISDPNRAFLIAGEIAGRVQTDYLQMPVRSQS